MSRLITLLAVAGALLSLPGHAMAATCSLSNHVLTLADSNIFTLERVGYEIEVRHGIGGELHPCNNLNLLLHDIGTINITTTGSSFSVVNIDLSGGYFAPGYPAESYSSEIEWNVSMNSLNDQLTVRGGDLADVVVAGGSQINLNASERSGIDADVQFNPGVDVLVLHGGAGNDRLDLTGGSGTPPGGLGRAGSLRGGEGNDVLRGGALGDRFMADPGDDQYHGGGGADTVDFSAASGVVADLTLAGPQATGEGLDLFSSIENLSGGNGDDVLRGDGGANGLYGGEGDDVLMPRGGDDVVDGGYTLFPSYDGGTDTVDYSDAPAGVSVNLGLGSQNTGGSGTDTLLNIENAIGSGFADQLTGTTAANVLDGQGGVDLLDALAGPDLLLARDGGPDTVACGEGDDAVVADDEGVDQIGTGCESVAYADTQPPETTIESGPSGTVEGATQTFAFSSSEPGSSFECAVDGAPFAACSTPAVIGPLDSGQHSFRVRASDAFGNTDPTPAERSFSVAAGDSGGGDGDGDGDGGGGDPLAGDSRRPALRQVSLAHRVFRVGARRTSRTAAARRIRRGTRVRYHVSEPATVTLLIERRKRGRRVRGRCRAPRPEYRGRPRCRRHRAVATLLREADRGRNRTRFTGRIGRKKLRPGRYRLTLRAVDRAGNSSRRVRRSFRIVRR